jgi:pyruvate dehydrogenase E1 component alpha subunit
VTGAELAGSGHPATDFADAIARLRAANEPLGLVDGRGLEALVAGAVAGVSRKTWILPGRRERACALLRGCDPERLDASRPFRVVPPGPSPAARAAIAVGLALSGDPALVFCGTGSVSYGAWFEAVNLAALHGAPVVFVVGWWATPGPFATQLVGGPAAIARGFGVDARVVDGHDAAAVSAAVAGVAGPRVVEARLNGRA